MSITSSKSTAFTEKAEAFYAQFHRLKQQAINHWWILLLTVALGLLIETLVTIRLQSFYRSEGKIIASGTLNINNAVNTTEAGGDFFDTQIELMESDVVRNRAEAKLTVTKPELVHSIVKLTVEQHGKTSIFTLTAIGKDKLYTQALLEAVMDEYLQFKRDELSKSSGSAEQNIDKILAETQREIDSQNDLIKAWQEKYSLPALKQEGNYAANYVAKLKQELAEKQTEYQLLGNLSLDQSLDRRQDNVDVTSLTSPGSQDKIGGVAADYFNAKKDIQLLQLQREELSQYLKPKHPKIISLAEKIAREAKTIEILKKAAKDQLVTQRESLRIDIDNTQKTIAIWEPKAVELNARIGEYERMDEKLTRAKNELQRNLDLKSNIGNVHDIQPETMSIMSPASDAVSIQQGIVKALVVGLLGGLIVGAGVLLLINQFDDRIRSFSEMQVAFNHPVIGHVPKSAITDRPLLAENDSRHMLFESFRNIRSSIFFMPYEGARPKTLLITSSIPNEGKSTVSSNFAVTLAMSGAKTLLIDADMRRGALHELFNVPAVPGLVEVLGRANTLKSAVHPTNVQNLSFLARGKGTLQANDLLLGKQTDALIKKIYSEYDYIVFDSAPVMAADDTSNLAPKVDGVIFVVRASFTQARLARRTLELLSDRQVNVLGLIFNYANTSAADYPYYRYEEYHKQPVA